MDTTTRTPNPSPPTAAAAAPHDLVVPAAVALRLVDKRSFATLATVSPAGRPHVAGVVYQLVTEPGAPPALYVITLRSSAKARNVDHAGSAAVCIPVRRLPVGPPSTVQFQARAEVLPLDDPDVRRLVAAGRLQAVTGHGELDLPGGCFVRLTLPRRIRVHGIGMSLRRLLRDPIGAGGVVHLAGDRGVGADR